MTTDAEALLQDFGRSLSRRFSSLSKTQSASSTPRDTPRVVSSLGCIRVYWGRAFARRNALVFCTSCSTVPPMYANGARQRSQKHSRVAPPRATLKRPVPESPKSARERPRTHPRELLEAILEPPGPHLGASWEPPGLHFYAFPALSKDAAPAAIMSLKCWVGGSRASVYNFSLISLIFPDL